MKELRHNGELGQKLYEDENGRHQTAYWLAYWLGSSEKRKKKKDTERRIVYVQREHTSERTFRKL